ncbi:hypothetical protein Q3H59_004161 [Pantoea sp. SORGH_AS 659]|nr:hypothetical protein [Pantoea sp. SORGH_AS_0659]
MKNVPSEWQGHHRILFRQGKESLREIILNVRWKTLTLYSLIGKEKNILIYS